MTDAPKPDPSPTVEADHAEHLEGMASWLEEATEGVAGIYDELSKDKAALIAGANALRSLAHPPSRQSVGEPAAWRVAPPEDPTDWRMLQMLSSAGAHDFRLDGWKCEPLYAAPPPPLDGGDAALLARVAELEGALRDARVFVQDCIEMGQDRASLGNLYGARDTIDAALNPTGRTTSHDQ